MERKRASIKIEAGLIQIMPRLFRPSISDMPAYSAPLYTACRLLDRLRVPVLRLLGRPGKLLVRQRKLRVAAFGCTVILTALLGSVFLPLWLLALGPVILGTPHVLSDVRYLVMRPGFHRRALFWIPVGAPLLAAGCGFYPMECGLAAVAAAALLSNGAWSRRLPVVALTGIAGFTAWKAGFISQIVFAHLHNLIALLLWWFWRPRPHWSAGLVPVFFAAAVILLGTGAIFPLEGAWSWFPERMDFTSHAAVLAPGLTGDWAVRLVVLFAFAQAVHYGIWLRLIPEDDRPRETPRPFTATLRAMEEDVGRPVLYGAVMIAAGIGIWAILDLAAARIGYLRMALFHGYLELIAGALLFIEGHHSTRSATA